MTEPSALPADARELIANALLPYQRDAILVFWDAQAHRLEECEKALRAVMDSYNSYGTITHVAWNAASAALATQQKNDQAESTTETTNAS